MTVNQLGSNQTQINQTIENTNVSVLYSYDTPVAIKANGKAYVTTRFFSRTTSKHINAWVSGMIVIKVSQSQIYEVCTYDKLSPLN
jgi:hypothetical protein